MLDRAMFGLNPFHNSLSLLSVQYPIGKYETDCIQTRALIKDSKRVRNHDDINF